jgi:DnaK suppressor protein
MDDFGGIEATLLEKRAELLTRLQNIKSNITRKRSADSQEQAQELENAEVIDALGNETQLELHLIAKALEQIKQGTFGSCMDCGITIPRLRLEAYPFADRCIECATTEENRSKY